MLVNGCNIICGDAMRVLREYPDEHFDLICTDPPYRVIGGGNVGGGFGGGVLKPNDTKIFRHNDISVWEYLPELVRVLKPGKHLYLMTNNLNLRNMLNCADEVGLGFHNLLRWDKNNRNANRWYMKDCEYTLFFYKPPAVKINNAGSTQGFAAPNPRNKCHPTEKPVELMQHYIENSSQAGDLVLDPFVGGGATALAAMRSGRRVVAIEKDLQYFATACGRIMSEVMA